MGQPGAEVIALVMDEDLSLMREAAKGGRMDDAVAVALKVGAGGGRRLREKAASCRRIDRVRRAGRRLPVVVTHAYFPRCAFGAAAYLSSGIS
jgi:hypothetical protein